MRKAVYGNYPIDTDTVFALVSESLGRSAATAKRLAHHQYVGIYGENT